MGLSLWGYEVRKTALEAGHPPSCYSVLTLRVASSLLGFPSHPVAGEACWAQTAGPPWVARVLGKQQHSALYVNVARCSVLADSSEN